MLGEDPTVKPLSHEQGSQGIMMDAIDPHHQVPVIHHEYPAHVAAAVRAALTDSELFESYNLPPKAIAPLEAGLDKAPRDSQINMRLAAIYAKVNRFADAARAAAIVQEVYAENGFAEEANKYAELARQYKQQAGDTLPQYVPGAASTGEAPAGPTDLSANVDPTLATGSFRASSVAHMFEEQAPAAQAAGEHAPDELTADAFGDMFRVSAAPPPPPKPDEPISPQLSVA